MVNSLSPQALIISGYGINCEEETAHAFTIAGAKTEIIHINNIIENNINHKTKNNYLKNSQILVFPGGFSYGDDTGAGKAFANKIKNKYWEEILEFVNSDKLVIGICNGFQILANLGLLPAIHRNYGERKIALTHNDASRYLCRWTDIDFNEGIWTKNIGTISLPIAHGEGKFYAEKETIEALIKNNQIAGKYVKGNISITQELDSNPNGSIENIAAITDSSKRIIGMMPHPERTIYFTQRPDWHMLKEQYKREGKWNNNFNHENHPGDGLKIFKNAVEYFK